MPSFRVARVYLVDLTSAPWAAASKVTFTVEADSLDEAHRLALTAAQAQVGSLGKVQRVELEPHGQG